MNAQYLVIDWHFTKAFGPFSTREDAEEWLARENNIYVGQYEEQEVSILPLYNQHAYKLENVDAGAS